VHADEIHRLNREYLAHDYPTDVLSFLLGRRDDQLCGEIVVSADMAVARCGEFGLSPQDELTLYLIHGALHLVGYDDKTPEQSERMREREQYYFGQADARAQVSDRERAGASAADEASGGHAAQRMPGE
jgi:probable rRNA maturation factor